MPNLTPQQLHLLLRAFKVDFNHIDYPLFTIDPRVNYEVDRVIAFDFENEILPDWDSAPEKDRQIEEESVKAVLAEKDKLGEPLR